MHRLESYIRLAFIFIFIFTILYLPISHQLKKTWNPNSSTNQLAGVILIVIFHYICDYFIYADFFSFKHAYLESDTFFMAKQLKQI